MRSDSSLMSDGRTRTRTSTAGTKMYTMIVVAVVLRMTGCTVMGTRSMEEVYAENMSVINRNIREQNRVHEEAWSAHKTDGMSIVDVATETLMGFMTSYRCIKVALVPSSTVSGDKAAIPEEEWKEVIREELKNTNIMQNEKVMVKVKVRHKEAGNSADETGMRTETETEREQGRKHRDVQGCAEKREECGMYKVMERIAECVCECGADGSMNIIVFKFDQSAVYYAEMAEVVKMIKQKTNGKYKTVSIKYTLDYNILYREDTREIYKHVGVIGVKNNRQVVIGDVAYTVLEYKNSYLDIKHCKCVYERNKDRCVLKEIVMMHTRNNNVVYRQKEGNVECRVVECRLEEIYRMFDIGDEEVVPRLVVQVCRPKSNILYIGNVYRIQYIVNTTLPVGKKLDVVSMGIEANHIERLVLQNNSEPGRFMAVPSLVEQAYKVCERKYSELCKTDPVYVEYIQNVQNCDILKKVPGVLNIEQITIWLDSQIKDMHVQDCTYMPMQEIVLGKGSIKTLYEHNARKYNTDLSVLVNALPFKRKLFIQISRSEYGRCVMKKVNVTDKKIEQELVRLTHKNKSEVKSMLKCEMLILEREHLLLYKEDTENVQEPLCRIH